MSVKSFLESISEQTTTNEVHSFVVLQKGDLIAKAWFEPYASDIPHQMFSVSKSFTSVAIGIAESEGYFSIKDKAYVYIRDLVADIDGEIPEFAKEATIEDFLMMAVGQEKDIVNDVNLYEEQDWVKAFYSLPFINKPGEVFKYNTGATYILSVILQKTTGKLLNDYIDDKIFQPMGIKKPYWLQSQQGYSTGGFGLRIITEDLAKFGQLLLQKGSWKGKQLIPLHYLETATSGLITGDGDSYGYQFWQNDIGGFRADGLFGQFCYVFPDKDLVIALTGVIDDTSIIREKIKAHLVISDLEQVGLISDLKLIDDNTKYTPKYHGHYKLTDSPMKYKDFMVTSNEDKMVIVPDNDQDDAIVIGLKSWETSEVDFSGFKETVKIKGVWQSETSLLIQYRLVETPYVFEGTLDINEKSLEVNGSYNVGMYSEKPLHIKGVKVNEN